MKKYSFFYHYNKPLSRATGSPKLTVHYKGVCHVVDSIECLVPTASRVRKTQPHVVIAGKGILRLENNKAILE